MSKQPPVKRKLALLIPAHNEELVIVDTIRSAASAGQPREDIYVISDGSHDKTVHLAANLLGEDHVLDQAQSGKAGAINNGIKYFDIVDRYEWMHISDADGVYSTTYFSRMIEHLGRLDPRYVAATGHLQSLPGGWISKFRTYEYAVGLEIVRRIQTFLDTIQVIPGPTCVFRTDILGRLDFETGALTEDMDLTIQIHRGRIGKIAYVPEAKAFTQDPKDFRDFYHQLLRWDRGIWQVIQRHRICRRPHRIDFFLGYMILEDIALLICLVTIPFYSWWSQNYGILALVVLYDLAIFFSINLWAAALNRRFDILGAFPLFYVLRYVNLYVLCLTWYETVVQKKFQTDQIGWSTAGRRYRIASDAANNH